MFIDSSSEEIILYTIHCPKCNVLKKKLDKAEVQYTECADEEKMKELGLDTLPVLSVGGFKMDFNAALNWLKEREE